MQKRKQREAPKEDGQPPTANWRYQSPPTERVTVKELRSERSKLLTEHFGYTNDSNPFGDKSLAEPFVWKKKNMLLQASGNKKQATAGAILQSSIVKVQEIKSVKKRREEREAEELLLQEQREQLQREREREKFQDYFTKEEEFHRVMHIKKTEIRAEQQREQPIDFFIKGLRLLNGEALDNYKLLEIAPHQVFTSFGNEPLTCSQIETLISDIKLHIGVQITSVDGPYQDFWHALHALALDALAKAQKRESILESLKADSCASAAKDAASSLAVGMAAFDDEAMSSAVAKDIDGLLCNQTLAQLNTLEVQVSQKLKMARSGRKNDDLVIDTGYWEGIYNRIPYYKARAVCADYHKRCLEKASEYEAFVLESRARQAKEKKQNGGDIGENENENGANENEIGANNDYSLENLIFDESSDAKSLEKANLKEQAKFAAKMVENGINPNADGGLSPELEPYQSEDAIPLFVNRGPHSPVLFPFDEFRHLAESIIQPEEDQGRRMAQRRIAQEKERKKRLAQLGIKHVLEPDAGSGNANSCNNISNNISNNPNSDAIHDPAGKITSYEEFVKKEKQTASPDEEVMASNLEQRLQQHYSWEDKYRPRKPRFFNRVRTGFYWTKYNSTHYDRDNPPPKAVQGYKFNIFYPDLIDPTQTPTWTLEPSDSPESIIIRFHAGPPYEDVAFKILSREWALDRTRGFRNVFDRGIMQLYFSFKKFIYRR